MPGIPGLPGVAGPRGYPGIDGGRGEKGIIFAENIKQYTCNTDFWLFCIGEPATYPDNYLKGQKGEQGFDGLPGAHGPSGESGNCINDFSRLDKIKLFCNARVNKI